MKTHLILPSLVVLLLALAACSQQGMQGTQQQGSQNAPAAPAAPAQAAPTQDTAAPAAPVAAEVLIKNFAFQPVSLTVKAGTTVTWTNEDSATHTIKFADSQSDQLGQGGRYSKTFNTPGSYEYNCGIHPSMKGVVVVE